MDRRNEFPPLPVIGEFVRGIAEGFHMRRV
jgi:hypothetical protein